MAQHRLMLNAAQLELTSKDIEIIVFSGKRRLGTLKVSKVPWIGVTAMTKNPA